MDLMFTFFTARTGSIATIKLIDLLFGKLTLLNHNYPGFLACVGLLFIYLAWYQTKLNRTLLFALGSFLLLGVIISSSRSALLATFIVFILMSFLEPTLRHNLKKIIPLGVVIVSLIIGFFFIYNIFLSKTASSYYLDKIYYRLYEEPMQMLGADNSEYNQWTGKRIGGSMSFRAVRWQDDLKNFTNLSFTEQFFGSGPKGYLKIAQKDYDMDGNIRTVLAPHNGYLIILFERGILGLLLFVIIIFSISISAIRVSKAHNTSFPFIYLLLIIAIYSFAQNAEITSAYTYLAFGCIIGNIVYSKVEIVKDIEVELVGI